MGAMQVCTDRAELVSEDAILRAFSDALDSARAFEGATAPNPPVGCVLLNSHGETIGVGAHERAGRAHAEAAAIAAARAEGRVNDIHTVIVTLEPCNHTGKTPPCAEAILATPAQAVWIGAVDPNPKVVGGGAARLANAGLDVRMVAELDAPHAAAIADEAERLIAPFAKHQLTGLPFVTVKQAINAEGHMVPPAGEKTFTSDASLELAHRLRKRSGAILTGSGTILADNPEFTVRRVPDFADARRHLAILDRRERVSTDYVAAAEARGFDVRISHSLETALAELGAAGVQEVLVEAGPSVTKAILNSDLWDEHVLITQGTAEADDTIEVRRNSAAAWKRGT